MLLFGRCVFLDDAQFRKKGWQNRNRIRTKNDTTLLSIPVHAHSYPNINEITIDNNKNWSKRHKKSILFNYAKAPYFEEFKGKPSSLSPKSLKHKNLLAVILTESLGVIEK